MLLCTSHPQDSVFGLLCTSHLIIIVVMLCEERYYRITGYFCGPEIFAFCSKTLNLFFCEFKFMRLIGAAK